MNHDLGTEYKEYLERHAVFCPENRALSLEEYAALAAQWNLRYRKAWDNGPDFAAIAELESALCV